VQKNQKNVFQNMIPLNLWSPVRPKTLNTRNSGPEPHFVERSGSKIAKSYAAVIYQYGYLSGRGVYGTGAVLKYCDIFRQPINCASLVESFCVALFTSSAFGDK